MEKDYTISVGTNSYNCISVGVCCKEDEIERIAFCIGKYYAKNQFNDYATIGYNEGDYCKVGEDMDNVLVDIM